MQKRHPISLICATSLVVGTLCGSASAAEFQMTPTQDALVRAAEPTRNFGAAGALSVAGASAVNGSGVPQGRYESVLQFDAGLAKAAFDAQYGAGNWELTAATLVLTSVAAPLNPIFNVGAGEIELRWISDDNWLQGIGTPMPPPVEGGGNEMTWDFLQTLVAGASNSLIAVQAVAVQDGPVNIPLTLTAQLAGDIMNGGFVSMLALPRTATVGFTVFALEYPIDPAARPRLVLTALGNSSDQGDLNCDGAVNVQDVQPFALALTDPVAYQNTFPACSALRADVNNDGLADGRDVDAFVDELINP